MSYRTPAYETDSANTGIVSWGGAGNYYSYSSGTFTVLRAGTGRVKGQLISWAGGESVAGLAADKGYLIGYSATNTLVAIDISTLESSDKKTLVSNYLNTYTNNVILFGIWTDGANPQIVKEDHEFKFPTEASVNEHFRLGHTFNFSGGQLSVLSSANRTIQTVGEDMLNDHGLETRIPDATGVAIDAMTVFQNGSGVAKSLNRRTFTVSGISTAPTAGAIYSNNGSQFTVLYTSLTGSAPNITGTLQCWTSSGNNNPLASGTLTKVSGTGDATVAYSAYAVPVNITTIYAPAGVPTALTSGGATRYGIVAVYVSKDDRQTPNTTSPTPKYFQVLSNTAYNSAANAANSIGTGLSPDLTQFTVPNELKAIELVLNGFVLLDGSTRIIPATTTNGFVNGVRTFKSVVGSTYSQGAVSTASGVNVSLDTTNFTQNLSSADINAQVAMDTIDNIRLNGQKINYILNDSAKYDITGWGAYNQATLAVSRTTTASELPRENTVPYGIKIVGTGNDETSNYVYYDFTLDDCDLSGKRMMVRFDVKKIGTYDGKLSVMISEQASRGTAITGSITTAIAAQDGTFYTEWLTGATTTLSLVIIGTGNMTSGDGVTISSVTVANADAVQGSAIGNWKSFAPTVSWSTNTTTTARYREVGDSIEVQISSALAGAPNSASYSISNYLPSGYTVDTSKLASTTAAVQIIGKASIYDYGTRLYAGSVCFGTSLYVTHTESGNIGLVDQVSPITFGNQDSISVNYFVPVNELSSNVTLANRALETFSADDGSNDVFGPNGALVPNQAVGTAVTRVFTLPSTAQQTDFTVLEYMNGQGNWQAAADVIPFTKQSSKDYGLRGYWSSPTQYTVTFGEGGIASTGATYASNAAAGWSWADLYALGARFRLRKTSGGASVGYPISSANIVGRTDGVAPASGMVGYVKEALGSSSTNTAGSWFNCCQISLDPGSWLIYSHALITMASGLTYAQLGLDTAAGGSGNLRVSGQVMTGHTVGEYGSASPAPKEVNISATTSYYLNALCGGANNVTVAGTIVALRKA